ncbi:PepSY domain-containing protein [Flavobacterium sp. UMI-01]|uniref:PepSY-associated TM helix domain-containing protein n=1 Tax=Flavobacterium sp. UMI-01 TaxID=1441053 RepID=UPI001C7D54EC|nr:PepSY-associated TM helix domain-containing protein [Flavobacterium sp. UMI-01]GIZ10142.1 sulfite reductase [Flavobacterium sp. UMI-01]
MKKNNFKRIIGKIHLLLGLSSGLIVFIIAITGCFYAFQEEIQNITEEYRFVSKEEKPFLPPSQLEAIARKELPGKVLHAIQYHGAEESVEAIFYQHDPFYHFVSYLNPYSGEVLATVNMEEGFFRFILDGHFYLWLPHKIGQTVVATATLLFVIMLISGLILWYPRNKNARKQRFSFKWKKSTKWKRKNYDLHAVTGFYVFLLALVFAITGLVWGFNWFAYSYYKVLGGEKSLVYQDPILNKSKLTVEKPIDKVWVIMKTKYPQAKSIEIHPPETDTTAIATNANPDQGTYWKTNYHYYDPYTLEEIEVDHIYGKLANAGIPDTLMRMNYDIHTGAIIGFPGKVVAFLISLFIASLPLTGFYIWWGRKKKKEPTTVLEES